MVKDLMGNEVEVGDSVSIIPRNDILWVAKIIEIKEPRISLVNPTQQGNTGTHIRVLLDMTLSAQIPVFPAMVKIYRPKEADSEKNPPPKPS
jgi:hypothetical protein